MTNTEQFNLRMPKEVHDLLNRLARQTGISKNQLILDAIAEVYGGKKTEGRGNIIGSTISTSIVSSSVAEVKVMTDDRLGRLEAQMQLVMEKLGLSQEPPQEEPKKTDEGNGATPDTITTRQLIDDYCDPGADVEVLGNLENYQRTGIEDDQGNTWVWAGDDRWSLVKPVSQPQPKAKPKKKPQAKPTDRVQKKDVAIITQTNSAAQAAKVKFQEWTGLYASIDNAKLICAGYYLGECIDFTQDTGWIAFIERLEIAIDGIPHPIPQTLDEFDSIKVFGKHFDYST